VGKTGGYPAVEASAEAEFVISTGVRHTGDVDIETGHTVVAGR
jgi:hypothetical protein